MILQEDEVDRYNAIIEDLQEKRAPLLEASSNCKEELEEAEKNYKEMQSRLRVIGESVDPLKASVALTPPCYVVHVIKLYSKTTRILRA